MALPGRTPGHRPGRWMVLVLTLALAGGLAAQLPNPVSSRIDVAESSDIESAPAIARQGTGQFVVAWTASSPDNLEQRVEARRLQVDGSFLGPLFTVDPGPNAFDPVVAEVSDGGFLVVWQRLGTATTTGEFATLLVGRRYDADGQPLADEGLIATSTATVREVRVDSSEPEGFVVSWRAVDDDSQGAVYTARFDNQGTLQLGPDRISTPSQNILGHDLAVTPTGDFLVVWNRQNDDGSEASNTLEGQRFAADAPSLGSVFFVKEGGIPPRSPVPTVAVHRSGEFVVAWSDSEPDDATSIRARRFSAEALPLGGELQVNDGGFSDFFDYLEPDLSLANDGRFLVVWRRTSADNASDIVGRSFFADPTPAEDFTIASFPTSTRQTPVIATGVGGDFVVTWTTDGRDGPGGGYGGAYGDIRGRAFTLPCPDDAGHACLQGERFQVEVRWRDFAGDTGIARRAPADSDASTLLWFFEEANWEMLVKMVDGCSFNGHHWVFAAATTNVETVLTVTDTETGQVRVYENPLGQSSPAVADTMAFSGCS